VVDPSTAFAIANQRFSREAERQADAGALARLDAAGIPRAGFAAFFRRIQKDTDMVPAWLSTHPASKERIDLIGAGPPTKAAAPVLSSEEWQAIKNACTRRATK
jgi:predicted Zn-dependent protease